MFSIRRYQEPKPGESRTVRYEGSQYGSAVSIFLVNADPGRGPDLHVHPYAETWVVRQGEAEFTIGDQRARGSSGDIVVGPANIPTASKISALNGWKSSASIQVKPSSRLSCNPVRT